MKRKSVLRMGAILLSAGFAVGTLNGKIDKAVLAEEEPIVESKEMSEDTGTENAQGLDGREELGILDGAEIVEDQTNTADAPEALDGIEIVGDAEVILEELSEIELPQKNIFIPVSEFLPVQEREDTLFLNEYEDYYLLHFESDSEMTYTVFFNQSLKEDDVALYLFDSEKNRVKDGQPVQGVMNFDEKNQILSLKGTPDSDYVLVISHAETYKEIGYTAKVIFESEATADQEIETESEMVIEPETERQEQSDAENETQTETESEQQTEYETESETQTGTDGEALTEAETERETESEALTEPETESETQAETESEALTEPETETESEVLTEVESEVETESESETETETESETETETETEALTETETESENETETESETEAPTLTSVLLDLDQDLDTVPVEFLEYLDNQDVYAVTLVYSDGVEKVLSKTDERYEVSVNYEDASETESTIRRTYHVTVKELSTGKEFDAAQSVTFGEEEPVEIKTEEMTTVILGGKKKWIMVRSTPKITGRYAMSSNQMIKTVYYASDDGEIVSAEDAFTLQEGVTYKFLIELN